MLCGVVLCVRQAHLQQKGVEISDIRDNVNNLQASGSHFFSRVNYLDFGGHSCVILQECLEESFQIWHKHPHGYSNKLIRFCSSKNKGHIYEH